jgi:hypothetical protein
VMNCKCFGVGAAALVMVLASAPAARANLVVNGGFEAGSFAGWATVPEPEDALFFVSGNPHAGHYAAWFGQVGPIDETIAQTFATDPGATYDVDFWLAHSVSDFHNDFSVLWNGSPVISMVNASAFGFTHYSFAATALGSSTTLMFAGREVLDYFFLDDVSVIASSANEPAPAAEMPEPATLILLGTGLSAVARASRRRRV